MLKNGKSYDVEAVLRARKKKTAIWNIVPVTDAIMLHYVMHSLYSEFQKTHTLRADWHSNLMLSSRTHTKSLPPVQVQLIAGNAAREANQIFSPVLGSLVGLDVRHVVIAFAQVVLKLTDQHRYQFTDDALVLQSIGIVSEAIEERWRDWNYQSDPVRYLFGGLMKQVDASPFFKVEAEWDGIAYEVLH